MKKGKIRTSIEDNMSTYYEQMDQDWRLCNSNYHQMVQVMMRLVKTLSPLIIDMLKWYPGSVIDIVDDKVEVNYRKGNSQEQSLNKNEKST